MQFTSYAQNFEDVMLWRCFKDLQEGFYIDVGAQDPEADSVTKLFYDKGWTGLNIEPALFAYEKLAAERPRDINLQIAVGEKNGTLDIWQFVHTGLSTAVKNFADRHISAGLVSTTTSVEMRTLESICNQYVDSTIHFMKIDVEGFERQVIEGANFLKYRPLVLVIEATEPNSQIENYQDWEHIILRNNYLHCYSDGLNRFYLSSEASHFAKHFEYPPNVFDDFILSSGKQAESEYLNLNHRSEEISRAVGTALALKKDAELQSIVAQKDAETWQIQERDKTELAENIESSLKKEVLLQTEVDALKVSLNLVLDSKSWKITQPLRTISIWFQRKIRRI